MTKPMTDSIAFDVDGLPATAGSKRAFVVNGKARIVDTCKRGGSWRQDVAARAIDAMGDAPLFDGAVEAAIVFFLPRPKGHFGTGRNASQVRPSAPAHPASKPDVLKMARAVEDALTGIVWRDDAQIIREVLEKRYSDRPGVCVVVRTLTAQQTATEREEASAVQCATNGPATQPARTSRDVGVPVEVAEHGTLAQDRIRKAMAREAKQKGR